MGCRVVPAAAGWQVRAVLASLLLLSSVVSGSAYGQEDEVACLEDTAPAPFEDRDDIPAAHVASVDCAHAHDVARGFEDGTYRPGAAVSRDAMASFVVRVLDAADVALPPAGDDRFTDIAPGSTHDEAIHRLKAAGIVAGGPAGSPLTSTGRACRCAATRWRRS